MRRIVIIAVAAALAILGVALVFRATDKVTNETASLSVSRPFRIQSGHAPYLWPDVSGSVVVWMDDRHSTKDADGSSELDDTDIYGVDLDNGRELAICTAPGRQLYPCIAGDIVVWSDRRRPRRPSVPGLEIYGYDLARRKGFKIPGVRTCVSSVDVAGATVVWADSRDQSATGTDIYAYDLLERREWPVCTARGEQWQPAVSARAVVWVDRRGETASQAAESEAGVIYARDLSTGEETRLSSPGQDGIRPKIDGETVTWLLESGADDDPVYKVVVYDLAAQKARVIPDLALHDVQYGLGDGVLIGLTGGAPTADAEVTGYDLQANSEFRIAQDAVIAPFPVTDDDLVVWVEADKSDPDLRDVLMGARLERK